MNEEFKNLHNNTKFSSTNFDFKTDSNQFFFRIQNYFIF